MSAQVWMKRLGAKGGRLIPSQTRVMIVALYVSSMADSAFPINLLCLTKGNPFYID